MACSAPLVASSAVGSRIALAGGGHILDQEFLLRWSRLSWRWRRARPMRSPSAFFAYALTSGMAYAAFSAIVLLTIGRGAASTKYATLSSLGNLPIVYMTASDGWVHDRFGTAWMLHSEALIAIICIVLGLALLRWINPPRRSDLVLP